MDAGTIMKRLHELEEENKLLKSLLAEHGIPFEAYAHDGSLTASLSLIYNFHPKYVTFYLRLVKISPTA